MSSYVTQRGTCGHIRNLQSEVLQLVQVLSSVVWQFSDTTVMSRTFDAPLISTTEAVAELHA